MQDAYIGCIFHFAGNFAPRGYMQCQGQLLPISQYTAVFAILGTTYGGDGITTFALPDLRGRAAVGAGQGLGLSNIDLGQIAGTENVTLLTTNLPSHNHPLRCDTNGASVGAPANNLLADSGSQQSGGVPVYSNGTVNGSLNIKSVGAAGSGQPVNLDNPYLGITYIICIEGLFPSRN
jgi:microcystin-dependent protein